MKHRALLLAAAVLVSSCSTANLTDRQIALAQAGVGAAEIALNVAELELANRLSDPDTPAWQLLAAQQAADLARKELAKARVRLERIEAERAAAKLAAAQAAPAIQATASK